MPNDQSISINNYLKQFTRYFQLLTFSTPLTSLKLLKLPLSFPFFPMIMKTIYGNLNEKQIIPFQILQFTEIESLL